MYSVLILGVSTRAGIIEAGRGQEGPGLHVTGQSRDLPVTLDELGSCTHVWRMLTRFQVGVALHSFSRIHLALVGLKPLICGSVHMGIQYWMALSSVPVQRWILPMHTLAVMCSSGHTSHSCGCLVPHRRVLFASPSALDSCRDCNHRLHLCQPHRDVSFL